MAGFDNNVMYADNVDFTGSVSPAAKVTLDGQLLIGSTASPNIKVSTLTAGTGVTITNGSGSITIGLTGGGAAVETINGDTGSISGNIVKIFANRATLNAGATVEFTNSATTSTFNVTDSNLNTFIGKNSGIKLIGADHTGIGYGTLTSITAPSSLCTAIGYQALSSNTSGTNNSAGGASSLINVTTGTGNTGFGRQAGTQLSTGSNNCYYGLAAGGTSGPQTGSNNTIIGANAGSNWGGAESSNIYLGIVAGTAAESNKMRLGTSGSGSGQVNTTFIAGIEGVTVSNPNIVTVNTSTDQMGSIASANKAVLTTGATGVPVLTALAIDGQMIIGSTAGVPAAGTITSTGGTITVTTGSNTLNLEVAGGELTWTDVTGATQTLAVKNGYVTDRGGGVTYTLPATATLGAEIVIVGKLGLATITPNANQQILIGSASGAVGSTGTAVSNNVGDCITLICITAGASTVWRAVSVIGTWTLTT